MDAITDFCDAISNAGLTVPGQITADGALHRFASNGKRSDDSGWYVLHLDGVPAGSFGCWRSGLSETWRADMQRELTQEERRAFKERMQAQRRTRQAEEMRRHEAAEATAAETWSKATPAIDHPYLTTKGIQPHGIRIDGERLVIPMRDASGKLTSLQYIHADGKKKFLYGGAVSGCYFGIGKPADVLCIAEGFATAASIHEATGHAVAVAFNAGNLKPVAEALRTKLQDIKIIICADNDTGTEGNPGMTKAIEAAKAINAAVAVPDFGDYDGTDFNDLHELRGAEAIRKAVENASESNAVTDTNSEGAALYRRLSDVKPEPINWLWQGRIAKGKVSIIAGDPGLGKSQTTASMAAIITTGGLWPVDRVRATPGNVIILSAEDDAADTIRPRLDAAGADVRKVYILDAICEQTDDGMTRRAFSLKSDLANLEAMVTEIGGAALVVVDPISAYLGSTDSHKNAEIRALLAPLSEMAARLGVAVVGVSHLNKSSGGNALSRVTGSLAFVAAARAAYIVSKDPDNETRRLFLPAKNNIGPDQTGLAFSVEGYEYGGIQTSRVMWEPDPVTMTADEAVTSHDPEERNERQDAKEFLLSVLERGPASAKEIYREAADAGIAKRTLDRAKSELGIRASKTRFDGGWEWKLPSAKVANPSEPGTNNQALSPEELQGCQTSDVATLATFDGKGDPPEAETGPGDDPAKSGKAADPAPLKEPLSREEF